MIKQQLTGFRIFLRPKSRIFGAIWSIRSVTLVTPRLPECGCWGGFSSLLSRPRANSQEPRMTMRIISFNGRPFAYAQDYEVHSWPQTHLAHLPQGSRAIDSFIGWPSMVGRGHGQAYLRLLAERLCAEGAPLVSKAAQ